MMTDLSVLEEETTSKNFYPELEIFVHLKKYFGEKYLKYMRQVLIIILTTKGSVSHQQAIEKAHAEYDKFKKKQDDILSPVEKHFIESIDRLEKISTKK